MSNLKAFLDQINEQNEHFVKTVSENTQNTLDEVKNAIEIDKVREACLKITPKMSVNALFSGRFEKLNS